MVNSMEPPSITVAIGAVTAVGTGSVSMNSSRRGSKCDSRRGSFMGDYLEAGYEYTKRRSSSIVDAIFRGRRSISNPFIALRRHSRGGEKCGMEAICHIGDFEYADGYWYERNSGRRVKLPDTTFGELCPRELDTFAQLATERIDESSLPSIVQIKTKRNKLHYLQKRLGAKPDDSHLNYTVLFGSKLTDVVERDTLKRLQKSKSIIENDDSTLFMVRRRSSCKKDTGNFGEIAPPSPQHKMSTGSTASLNDAQMTESFQRQALHHRDSNPLSRRSGVQVVALGKDESELLNALSENTLSNSGKVKSGKKDQSSGDMAGDLLVTDMPMVPLIIIKCCEFINKQGGLTTEGIFRLSGAASRIKKLKETFEINPDYEISSELYTVMDVASLLKDYLRSLPEPLISSEYFNTFTHLDSLESESEQIEHICLLLALLPIENRDTLQALLKFLTQVVEHSDTNKMGLNNVATIFAPCFLKPMKTNSKNGTTSLVDSSAMTSAQASQLMAKLSAAGSKGADISKMMDLVNTENTAIIKCTSMLIQLVDEIFVIPATLHNEILRKVAENDTRIADILIKRKAVQYNFESGSSISSPIKEAADIDSKSLDNLDDDAIDMSSVHNHGIVF